jgi:hypothetical protein
MFLFSHHLLLILIVAVWSLWSTTSVYGQSEKYEHFSVGFGLGTIHYQGDLDDNGFEIWRTHGSNMIAQRLMRMGGQINLNYHMNPYLALRVGLGYGVIRAADSLNRKKDTNYRGLHFRTPVTEASFQVVVEPFANNDYYRARKQNDVYFMAGIAFFYFNPQTQPGHFLSNMDPLRFPRHDQWIDLQPIGTEGQNLPADVRSALGIPEPYRRFQVAIPFGIGYRRAISRLVDLRVEISLRKTFTDYIDDVSRTYVDPSLLIPPIKGEQAFYLSDRSGYANYSAGRSMNPNNPYYQGAYPFIHGPGPKERRGDSGDNDWYGFISVGFSRILR